MSLDIRFPFDFTRRSCSPNIYTAILLLFSASVVRAHDAESVGYKYGQSVPVSCLSRSIESGEHVTDPTGALHYTPFPICAETSRPLSFRFGVSETVTCTLDPVSDTLYHLLEYYVHSDVPLTCRVPTLPLEQGGEGVEGRAFTPLTVGLHGTLQLSHLHVWGEMNVLMHRAGISQSKEDEKKMKKRKWKDLKKSRGLVYAGTAYSLPSTSSTSSNAKNEDGAKDDAVENRSLDPWAAGQGAKVVRGEPLTLTFHVSWVHGEDVPEQTGYISGEVKSKDSNDGGVLAKVLFFLVAAGCGAVGVMAWEKWVKSRRGRGGSKRDGILGYSGPGKIVIGNSAFGAGKGNGNVNGYGGYSSGKRD